MALAAEEEKGKKGRTLLLGSLLCSSVRPSAGWAEKGRIAVMVIRLGAQIRFIARVVKCSNSNREEQGEWGVRGKTERQ